MFLLILKESLRIQRCYGLSGFLRMLCDVQFSFRMVKDSLLGVPEVSYGEEISHRVEEGGAIRRGGVTNDEIFDEFFKNPPFLG